MMNSLNVHLFDVLTNQDILAKGLFPKSEEAKSRVPGFASEFITLLKTQTNEVKTSIAQYMKNEGLHFEAMRELVDIFCKDMEQEENESLINNPTDSSDKASRKESESGQEIDKTNASSSKKIKIELMSLERLQKEERKMETKRILVYLEILIIITKEEDQVLRQLLEAVHPQKLIKMVEEILKSPDNSTLYDFY